MKDERAEIIKLKAERAALVAELRSEKKRASSAEKIAEEAERDIEKRLKRIAEQEKRIDEKEAAASLRFALKLKELKLFSDKIARLSESGETVMKKAELVDLFKDFLKNLDRKNPEKVSKKISRIIGEDAEDDGFDLDDILSPKGDMDLKRLCVELGVYQGDGKTEE